MKKLLAGALLCLPTLQTIAACPTLETNNWVIQSALKPAALTQVKRNYDGGSAHFFIRNGQVYFTQGVNSMIRFEPISLGVTAMRSGSGSMNVDAATCRMSFSFSTTATGFMTTAKGTKETTVTSEINGKGEYVKLIQGFAGKYTSNTNSRKLPGTFTMYPE